MNTLYLSVANYTAVRDLPDQVTIDGQTMSVLQALQYAKDFEQYEQFDLPKFEKAKDQHAVFYNQLEDELIAYLNHLFHC